MCDTNHATRAEYGNELFRKGKYGAGPGGGGGGGGDGGGDGDGCGGMGGAGRPVATHPTVPFLFLSSDVPFEGKGSGGMGVEGGEDI